MCAESDQYSMEVLRKEVETCLEENISEIESGEIWIPSVEEGGDEEIGFLNRLVDKIKELELSEAECRIILESDNFLKFALEIWHDCPDLSMLSLLEIIFVRAEEVQDCDYERTN